MKPPHAPLCLAHDSIHGHSSKRERKERGGYKGRERERNNEKEAELCESENKRGNRSHCSFDLTSGSNIQWPKGLVTHDNSKSDESLDSILLTKERHN